MYPGPKASEPPKACNPRQFVDMLDELIVRRILFHEGAGIDRDAAEEIELLKRHLTDYLLVNDKRGGLYVQGEHR